MPGLKIFRAACAVALSLFGSFVAEAAAENAQWKPDPAKLIKFEVASPKALRNLRSFYIFQMEVAANNDTSHLAEVMPERMLVHSAGDDSMHLWATGEKRETREIERGLLGKGVVFKNLQDHRRVIEEAYAVGDVVTARWRIEGTGTGDLLGFPAKGKQVVFHETGFVRFDENGRMIEGTFLMDVPEFLNSIDVRLPVNHP